MEFKKLADKRYSCRKFEDKKVEREKINECIKAARVAPSACNAQPWKFVVADEPEIKERTAKAATTGKYKFSRFIKRAPVIIAAVADKGSFMSKAGSLVRNTRFYLLDMGIVCEHIVLQATELGLGTCYVGWFNEKGVKKVLNIPKKMEIPLLICMGYPQKSYKDKDPIRRRAESEQRKPLDNILFFNKYKS
ncbi:MAG: nitroreductase family protein [Elusimicrobiota bacterium]